jgi:putative NADPH-quinone reductase
MQSRKQQRHTEHENHFGGHDALPSNVVSYPVAKRKNSPRILIINGHPDPRPTRFCAALCEAYAAGGRSGGRETQQFALGSLAVSALTPEDGIATYTPSRALTDAFELVRWANQLVIIFPLWLNAPPAPLREFFAQMFKRDAAAGEGFSALGCSARATRLVITMELPSFAHRLLFRAGPIFTKATNPLHLPGTNVRETTFVGSVDVISPEQRMAWLQTVREFGISGS